LDRRLGVSQSQSERGGEEKKSQPLPGLETPIFQFVAQLTNELSRLNADGKIILKYILERMD
jgi:hypothetical protein